ANSKGADSYFHSREGVSVGVADGVGEWEWRFKCNPRGFADELMSGSEAAIRELYASSEAPPGPEEAALAAMVRACGSARSFGSSTALVASLDGAKGLLGIANVGDSSLVVLRSESVGSLLRWRVTAHTKEQQHAFNCPFQLSCMPTQEDFPKLMAEGKHALVRAIQRNPNAQMDLPTDADRYTFQVQEGDLIVLGTDGVFDNLHLDEICELASRSVTPFEARQGFDVRSCELEAARGRPCTDPGRIARALAEAALIRSRDTRLKSPFSLHAQKAGLYHVGGKMDDITCVCAWVARTTSS
ncbi:unnamed protein product, partial [Prorocentrum cordatum]